MIKVTLTGRLAVISGATGVLGRKIAEDLAEAGAELRLLGRDPCALEPLALGLSQQYGRKVEVAFTDFSSMEPNDAFNLIEDADILVNAAAIQGPIGAAWNNDWQAWREAVEVNMFAPVLLSSLAAKAMCNRGWGRIINISGGGATSPRPNFSSYAVAKTGLARFTEILAAELSSPNVTANAVAPGAFRSSLTAQVLRAGKNSGGAELNATRQLDDLSTRQTVTLASALCLFLTGESAGGISGRLIAAKWDDWKSLPDHLDELTASDLFTLRRITPKDRGLTWGSN